MAILVFQDGARAGEEIALQAADLVIGRRDDCDLVLDDDLTSGHHARIYSEGERWLLSDLNSTNGTLLNNEKVSTEAIALKHDDLIQIGNVRARFKSNGAAPKAPHAPVAPPPAARKPAEEAPVAPPPAARKPAEEAPVARTQVVNAKPSPAAAKAKAPAAPSAPPPAAAPAPPPAARADAPPVQASEEDLALVERMSQYTEAIRREVAKIIIGQREVLDQVLMCMIAGGHALLVGLPGMAKTTMVSAIARVLDMNFKRIQFTPDLMPTDITGTEVLETNKSTGDKEFKFMRGPIFCNLLLADEINRTPPKTQAALLEAMQEKCVTVGTTTYKLEAPFFVLATQNPIEQEGTYPLPEAQMDRFMFNVWVDYPLEHEEEQIIGATTVTQVVQPEKVLSREQVIQLQQVVRKIPVSEHVIKYTIRLVRATRPRDEKAPAFVKEYLSNGAGPRAGQSLIMAAKARAVLDGRIHVSCKDIKDSAIPVLRHRVYPNFAADSEGLTSMDLVKKLIEAVEEPSEKDYK